MQSQQCIFLKQQQQCRASFSPYTMSIWVFREANPSLWATYDWAQFCQNECQTSWMEGGNAGSHILQSTLRTLDCWLAAITAWEEETCYVTNQMDRWDQRHDNEVMWATQQDGDANTVCGERWFTAEGGVCARNSGACLVLLFADLFAIDANQHSNN